MYRNKIGNLTIRFSGYQPSTSQTTDELEDDNLNLMMIKDMPEYDLLKQLG